MAELVFGIVLGDKEGFEMEAGEAQKLEDFVLTTAFIMRLSIFILLGAQVDNLGKLPNFMTRRR